MIYAFKILGLITFSIVCIGSVFFSQPSTESNPTTEADLENRVARLESTVASLERRIQNHRFADQLSGHWIEKDCLVSGKSVSPADEVAWRMATNASCDRYILAPEVDVYSYGKMSIDTSTSPISLDFKVRHAGGIHTVKGIVRQSFGTAEIVIPGKLFDKGMFIGSERPKDFKSTDKNGYRVFKLIRENYKKTGVWE